MTSTQTVKSRPDMNTYDYPAGVMDVSGVGTGPFIDEVIFVDKTGALNDAGHPLYVESAHSYTNIATSTTTVVKAAPGVFAGISINTGGTGSTATVYDNATAGSGTKIGTFATTAQGVLKLDAVATAGITVVTADGGAAANITVLWA